MPVKGLFQGTLSCYLPLHLFKIPDKTRFKAHYLGIYHCTFSRCLPRDFFKAHYLPLYLFKIPDKGRFKAHYLGIYHCTFSKRLSRDFSKAHYLCFYHCTFSRRLPRDFSRYMAVSRSPLAQRNLASSIFHDHVTPRSSPPSRVCTSVISLCSCLIRNKAFSATCHKLFLLTS